jgi:N-acetylglucosamine-6-phosphate deacetylase
MENMKLQRLLLIISMYFNVFPLIGQARIEALDYRTGKPVAVTIENGKITGIHPLHKLPAPFNQWYIAPGLIDNQVNGFAGVSFGLGGSELTSEGVRKATHELWKRGVTSWLATLTTNSHNILLKNFELLGSMKKDPALHGSMAGFHLEGPYISPIDGFRGAHPLLFVRKPDWNEFMEYYKASGSAILTVTIAPETEDAMGFIRKCTGMGIVVALGHHNASRKIVDDAVLNGARISTHLGNGCANLINRHDNPLWPQLANDGLMISIICDGFHLRDEEIKTFWKVKGTKNCIITSDVTSFAGMPPGQYTVEGGAVVELTEEGMLRYPAQNVLYGSATPLSVGVAHIMKVTGCCLSDAITMAAANPAKLYGLNDRGSLEPGKRADLILFRVGEKDLIIGKTWVEGELVYEKE